MLRALKKKKVIVMEVIRRKQLKHMIAKVLKGLSFLASIRRANYYYVSDIDDDDDVEEENNERAITRVPEDVREGHFAVIAMQGEERKRFVVELDYLTDPAFLRLLEEAGEEYGYEQKGALALPCMPHEIQNIIENRRRVRVDSATT